MEYQGTTRSTSFQQRSSPELQIPKYMLQGIPTIDGQCWETHVTGVGPLGAVSYHSKNMTCIYFSQVLLRKVLRQFSSSSLL